MKSLRFCVLFFAVASGFVGCSKGSAGPAGPAGPDSVMHSAWITVSMTYNTTDSAYEQNIAANSITQAILDSGMILSYLEYISTSGVTEIVPASVYIAETFTPGNILLSSQVDYTGSGINYRYLIIRSAITITGGRQYSKQELKTMSYQSLSRLIGISADLYSN